MSDSRPAYRIGVDVGGTFVDFALCDAAGEMAVHKVPADPADPAGAIMRGMAELAEQRGVDVEAFLGSVELVVHGTTVATNAVLTGGGSRTGLLTTQAHATRWRCAGASRRSPSTTSTKRRRRWSRGI